MMALCIFPGGIKKIWDISPEAGPTLVKDVYIGTFAKKCKEYAVKFYPESWWVLSAKYGFLYPDDIIPGPYRNSFDDPNSDPIPLLTLAVLALNKYWREYNRMVVLGGINYVDICRQVFIGKEILTPLIDCTGIDQMMDKLSKAIFEEKEL